MLNVIIKKSLLEEKKELLKKKERLLNEKEKIIDQKRLINIGRLASKANLGHLDEHTLFGGFLELSKHLSNQSKLMEWKEKSEQETASKQRGNPITISFKGQPNKNEKQLLKIHKFKWNSFRGEYYGFGDKGQITKLFEKSECKIDLIK